MSRDIAGELTIMFTEEKRKAYDAGAMAAMDYTIELCKASGGRLSTMQLLDLKNFLFIKLNEANERDKQDADQQANEAEVQPDRRLPSAAGLQPITGGAVYLAGGESPPTEEGQAGEGESQAESEES